MDDFRDETGHAGKTTISVPVGHMIISHKWIGTEFIRILKGKLQVIYEDESYLDVADFHMPNGAVVVYVAEVDLIADPSACRRRCVKLSRRDSKHKVVIVERTSVTAQYYGDFQKFVCLSLAMKIVPVTSHNDTAQFLEQLANNCSYQNPFLTSNRLPQIDRRLLLTAQTIPSLGEVSAKSLLGKFTSIQEICDASIEQLAEVIGIAKAQKVKSFFTESVS